MFGIIQISTIFIIFNINFINSLYWPDLSDINSINNFFETFNYKIDNEYKIKNYMDQNDKNNQIINFITEIMRILNKFNETNEYKSNFFWSNFNEKLKNYRINKKIALSLFPQIIVKSIKHELYIIENSFNYFFNIKINNYINDVEQLCSFLLNYSISTSKLKYSYFKDIYSALTTEIDTKEAKSKSNDINCYKHLFLQDLYDLSKEILRGFLLKFIRFSIAISLKSKCTNLNVEKKLIKERNYFITNIKEFINFTYKYLGNYSSYLYACDFNNHIRNKTYIELERMIQIVIHNEYYLNKAGSCSNNCNIKKEEFKPEINSKCMNLNCQYMGNKFEICELHNNVRRYQWFKDGNNIIYGNNTKCEGKITKLSSWYNFWMTRYCDYCVCTCTAKPHRVINNQITAISFQDQISDTDNNKVIVDLKFVIQNNTIYINIKEGKLLSYGKIDNNTLLWKSLDNCTIFDKFTFCVYPPQKDIFYGSRTAQKDFGYPKILNLDDLIVSTESIVTGVRFRSVGDLNTYPKLKNNSVELQIRVTDFNYKTGKLSKIHNWISSTNQNLRTELLLTRPDNPVKSPKNIPNLKKNQFIKFKVSDIKKDAGQSTVPFFDARPVENQILFPLKGIGLFHRGYDGFGGFIAFKIFIINPQEYMNPNLGVIKKTKILSNNNYGWDSFSLFKWFS